MLQVLAPVTMHQDAGTLEAALIAALWRPGDIHVVASSLAFTSERVATIDPNKPIHLRKRLEFDSVRRDIQGAGKATRNTFIATVHPRRERQPAPLVHR